MMVKIHRIMLVPLLILISLAVAGTTLATVEQQEDDEWDVDYWDNDDLSGSPDESDTLDDLSIDEDWGDDNPISGIDDDDFSVRWTRRVDFDGGRYRFELKADEGARVYLDDNKILDGWTGKTDQKLTHERDVSDGLHDLRVEFQEDSGEAYIQFDWDKISDDDDDDDTNPEFPDWKAEFFNNTTLSGTVVRTFNTSDIRYEWGSGSPGSGVNNDNFSGRFSRTLTLGRGTYYFDVEVDDGVRFYFNNQLIMNSWDLGPGKFVAVAYTSGGSIPMRLEYKENTGNARVRLIWYKLSDDNVTGGSPAPAPTATPIPGQPTQPPSGGAPNRSTVVLNVNSPGVVRGGNSAAWNTVPSGGFNNGQYIWNYNHDAIDGFYNWVRWYPNLAAGAWEVYVYVPADNATTKRARYWVHHAGGYTLTEVDQSAVRGQWVSLGTYQFNGASYEFVSLSDVSFELDATTRVAYDTVRFEPR